jgi:hypothetical protein
MAFSSLTENLSVVLFFPFLLLFTVASEGEDKKSKLVFKRERKFRTATFFF